MALACAACGAAHDPAARFCSVCGAALTGSCPACGAEHHAGAAFCSTCGTALVDEARRVEALVAGTDERRVVTIVFADLAGSTELGGRLDPEDVRSVQAEFFTLVHDEVVRFGGMTEKFVGDAVMAVFGVPQAHEDDPDRAVRAALAVQARFPAFADRVRERHRAAVGLRIGVNTGEVVAGREAAARGELMVSGDAVNVAARLQQLAEVGAVLVGERTRRATRDTIRYERHGQVVAKGKEAPLDAWRATDVTAPSGARRANDRVPLIGRASELEFLHLCATRARRDRVPQLVTVYGQAGVGKTRLLSEFVGQLDDVQVLVGRCVPYGDGITYLPLSEISSRLAGVLEDDPAEVALAKVQAAVERVVPPQEVARVVGAVAWTMGLSLPDSHTGLAGGADVRWALHDAWGRYVHALGQAQLVVIVVEDIHWASEALLDLVEHVVASLADTQVLVVCPARQELLAARPSWGGGRLNSSSLTLAPLRREDSTLLVGELLESDVISPVVVERIVGTAEGNPFFVEEMLAMLMERGALTQRDGAWVPTNGLEAVRLPDSIHGIIAARIDLLSPDVRDALRRCSIMGRVFWPSAVGVADDDVTELVDRALVAEQSSSGFSGRREFAFKHALTREVAYATLPLAERRVLHQRVADWLHTAVPDRQAETVELVAYHLDQAIRHGADDEALRHRAFAMLSASGDAAIRRGSYSSAARLLGRALELAGSDQERAAGLLLAARVDVHNSNYERARARLDEVVELSTALGDAGMHSDALGWRARAAWLSGNWDDALASSQAAVATLEGQPESPELARALARLSQIEMLRGLPVAAADASRAIEVAHRVGERVAEANARTNRFTALSSEGVLPEMDEMHAVVDLALAAGAPDESVRAVVNYFWGAATLGPPEAAETTVRELLGRIGPGLAADSYAEYLRLSIAALAHVPMGRWDEADAAVAEHEPVVATNRLVWLWVVSGLALRRGHLDVTDRYLPELVESALQSREPQRVVPMVSVAAPRALLAGEPDAVRSLAETTLELPTMAISWAPGGSSIMRAAAAVGAVDLLVAFEEKLRTGHGLESHNPSLHVAQSLRAQAEGRLADALSLMQSAAAVTERLGRRYEAACLTLEVAWMHEALGELDSAAAARARADDVLVALRCVNPY